MVNLHSSYPISPLLSISTPSHIYLTRLYLLARAGGRCEVGARWGAGWFFFFFTPNILFLSFLLSFFFYYGEGRAGGRRARAARAARGWGGAGRVSIGMVHARSRYLVLVIVVVFLIFIDFLYHIYPRDVDASFENEHIDERAWVLEG